MNDRKQDPRFDALAVQLHDWTEAAVALDAGHFPREMLNELDDLIEELNLYLEETGDGDGDDQEALAELFVTPEMAEVIERFPRVRRQLEEAWGVQLTELIAEEGTSDFSPLEEDEE